MSGRNIIFWMALMLLLSANPVWAAQPTPWRSLSNEEKTMLMPHQENWGQYTPHRQQRLLQGARRYQELGPVERQRMDHARERYKELTPHERRRLRENYLRSRED